MFRHVDALRALDTSQPLERKLAAIHEALSAQVDSVERISVAAYDPPTDTLKTFLASSPGVLDVYAHLISAVVAADMFALRVLAAAV